MQNKSSFSSPSMMGCRFYIYMTCLWMLFILCPNFSRFTQAADTSKNYLQGPLTKIIQLGLSEQIISDTILGVDHHTEVASLRLDSKEGLTNPLQIEVLQLSADLELVQTLIVFSNYREHPNSSEDSDSRICTSKSLKVFYCNVNPILPVAQTLYISVFCKKTCALSLVVSQIEVVTKQLNSPSAFSIDLQNDQDIPRQEIISLKLNDCKNNKCDNLLIEMLQQISSLATYGFQFAVKQGKSIPVSLSDSDSRQMPMTSVGQAVLIQPIRSKYQTKYIMIACLLPPHSTVKMQATSYETIREVTISTDKFIRDIVSASVDQKIFRLVLQPQDQKYGLIIELNSFYGQTSTCISLNFSPLLDNSNCLYITSQPIQSVLINQAQLDQVTVVFLGVSVKHGIASFEIRPSYIYDGQLLNLQEGRTCIGQVEKEDQVIIRSELSPQTRSIYFTLSQIQGTVKLLLKVCKQTPPFELICSDNKQPQVMSNICSKIISDPTDTTSILLSDLRQQGNCAQNDNLDLEILVVGGDSQLKNTFELKIVQQKLPIKLYLLAKQQYSMDIYQTNQFEIELPNERKGVNTFEVVVNTISGELSVDTESKIQVTKRENKQFAITVVDKEYNSQPENNRIIVSIYAKVASNFQILLQPINNNGENSNYILIKLGKVVSEKLLPSKQVKYMLSMYEQKEKNVGSINIYFYYNLLVNGMITNQAIAKPVILVTTEKDGKQIDVDTTVIAEKQGLYSVYQNTNPGKLGISVSLEDVGSVDKSIIELIYEMNVNYADVVFVSSNIKYVKQLSESEEAIIQIQRHPNTSLSIDLFECSGSVEIQASSSLELLRMQQFDLTSLLSVQTDRQERKVISLKNSDQYATQLFLSFTTNRVEHSNDSSIFSVIPHYNTANSEQFSIQGESTYSINVIPQSSDSQHFKANVKFNPIQCVNKCSADTWTISKIIYTGYLTNSRQHISSFSQCQMSVNDIKQINKESRMYESDTDGLTLVAQTIESSTINASPSSEVILNFPTLLNSDESYYIQVNAKVILISAQQENGTSLSSFQTVSIYYPIEKLSFDGWLDYILSSKGLSILLPLSLALFIAIVYLVLQIRKCINPKKYTQFIDDAAGKQKPLQQNVINPSLSPQQQENNELISIEGSPPIINLEMQSSLSNQQDEEQSQQEQILISTADNEV